MKIFNYKIDLKQVLLVTALLLIGNGVKILVLYYLRIKGDIDFYNYFHHVTILIFSIVALLSVLVSFRIINKIDTTNTILKFVKVYGLSFLIFDSIGLVLDYILWISFNGSNYDFVFRFVNMLTVAFAFADIFALTSAFLYFRQSQKAVLELEQIEKEKATLQSQMLQKNLEPHFLFNNLSVLSGLAKKNPELIEDFIDDFSDVYRYYLNHGKKQLVELENELIFLKNYMGLMEKRFGSAYKIEHYIENSDGYIIPCSLQLCVENAIKHNKGNEEKPVLISLSRKEDTIIIKNKLNKVDFTLGTGTGNDYLKRQYLLNFNKNVVITETKDEFMVTIPLIL
ncbi:histidine kinase [Aquimarina sp. ERC-38]|uniref:sensor histidine kinase n=1 Tax=Aquimarina sp. ERC-38 TaxID=2949996 RepID=UPI00224580F0|nr:sensor histidine kinase [Aquimarina sp. ERC-38]UZO80694.1 histidine kinase [Aquimarina sp. ERC-38]